MRIKAIRAGPHVRADDPALSHRQIIQTDFRSDSNAPVDRLEGRVAVEKIKCEPKRLIEETLFTFAEKRAAAGTLGALIAGRWYAPAVKKGFSRRRDVQKSLLAEHLGPNGLVALIAIAVEGVVPSRACVNIFATLRIASIVRLRKRPTIRNGVMNIGNRREIIWSELLNVSGIGIETMPKFAKGSRHR